MADRTYTEVTDSVKMGALNINVSLTTSSTHAQAMKAVETVCSALHSQEMTVEATRRLLGRTLAVVQDGKLYEPEFTSFEQFSQSIATRFRISRATLRDTLFIARRLPDLTVEQAESIPMVGLTLVARAAKDAPPATVRHMLKDAASMPVNELRTTFQQKGYIAAAESQIDGVKVSFVVTKATYERWVKLVGERDATTVFIDAVNMLYKELTPSRPMSNTRESRAKVVGRAVA